MTEKLLHLETLLSHREPMILLDQALDYGDDFASAQLQIHPDSRFFDTQADGVPAWVGIEYMAQTMGIWSGSQQLLKNRKVEIAFLLGSRHYQCSHSVFANGSQLLVQCKVLFCGENGVGAFECTIDSFQPQAITTGSHPASQQDTVTASARINAFLPNDSAAFLRREL